MILYEYQAKSLFETFGIPTVRGAVTDNPDDAMKIASRLGNRVAIKAQVLVGGRGKAGGIKVAHSPEEVKSIAEKILSMNIKSIQVKKILITEAIEIEKEFYISLTIDRVIKRTVLIGSGEGGVDIEELAEVHPDKIHLLQIDPFLGIEKEKVKTFLSSIFREDKIADQAVSTVSSMYSLFMEKDCSLVEINPFALTSSGKLVALDAKIIIDDNALFKHPDMESQRNSEEYSSDELEAKHYDLSFVNLDGTIGCIVNGAGLAMATMDLIKLFGASPANFLDVGGSSSPQKVTHAFEILSRNKNIKAVLINIFGGITRCDDIAKGILYAKEKMNLNLPLVIRLIGTNEIEGRNMLKNAGISVFDDLVSAVKEVVKYAESL